MRIVPVCAAVLALCVPASAQDAPPQDAPPQDAPPPAKEKPPEAKPAPAPAEGERAPVIPRVDEIVVSAVGGGVPAGYAGGRDVLDREVLDEYPAANIQEVLRRVPGVYVLPEAGNDGRVNIGLRGNDPRRSGQVTILVDGIPIAEGPYGQQDVDALPITFERVDRIDVIRGGASIRYGPNSAGGVINLVTAPIPEAPRANVSARYGSHADVSFVGSAGGTWDGFGVLVTGVDKGGDGFRENSAYDIGDGSAKFRHAFDEHDVLTFAVSRYVEDAEMPGGLTQAAYDEDPSQSLRFDGRMRADQTTYSAGFTHDAGPRTSFGIAGWWKGIDRRLDDIRPVLAPFTNYRVQDTHSEAGALEARYGCPADLGELGTDFYVSARFLMEKVRDDFYTGPFGGPQAFPPILDAKFAGRSTALFLEDTAHFAGNVDLAAGGRAESLAMDSRSKVDGSAKVKAYNIFLPEASLTWNASPKSALYASFQQSFGPPQYETGFDPASTIYSDVKPEYADLYEVGGRTRDVDGLEASFALFHTQFRDRLQYVNTSGGSKLAYNTGKEQHRGLEVGANWELGRGVAALEGFSVYATGTWLDATIENGQYEGNRSPHAPERLASWGARWEHPAGFWARVGGTYSGDAFKDAANTETPSADGVNGPVPAYVLWDAAIGWRQDPEGEGFSIQAGVTNVFEEEYYRRFSTGIYPGAPRQYFAAVAYVVSF